MSTCDKRSTIRSSFAALHEINQSTQHRHGHIHQRHHSTVTVKYLHKSQFQIHPNDDVQVCFQFKSGKRYQLGKINYLFMDKSCDQFKANISWYLNGSSPKVKANPQMYKIHEYASSIPAGRILILNLSQGSTQDVAISHIVKKIYVSNDLQAYQISNHPRFICQKILFRNNNVLYEEKEHVYLYDYFESTYQYSMKSRLKLDASYSIRHCRPGDGDHIESLIRSEWPHDEDISRNGTFWNKVLKQNSMFGNIVTYNNKNNNTVLPVGVLIYCDINPTDICGCKHKWNPSDFPSCKRDRRIIYISDLTIDKYHRHKRLGTKLLKDFIQSFAIATIICLEVETTNKYINWYNKLGFRIQRVVHDFYGKGRNAYKMILRIE